MARQLRPLLILLMGLPGAGKSTLARALERRLGLPRVDRDAIRAAMFRSPRWNEGEKRAANAAVWEAVAILLRDGRGAIVDGMTFASLADRRRGRALARRSGVRHVEIFVDCPVRLAQRRVAASRHPAADRTAARVQEVAVRFAPVGARTLRIDARAPTAEQLRTVLAALA